jgi:hypothetical protein
MRTIESRRFVAGGEELRLFLVEEKGHRLPFRIRLKHGAKAGVVAGFVTEAEALSALEVQVAKAVAAKWTHVPAQVRLALEIPAAPGAAPSPVVPGCAHDSIQAYLPKLAPGKSIVCPDCAENVKA